MKTFHDFLQEMALKSYRTDFHHATKEGEGFFTDKDGSRNVGVQVRRMDPATIADIRSRFSEKDRAVITHPRTARTLESRLARSGYDFNILFIEDISGTAGRYRRQVESFIKKNGIQKEGHITFVKSATSGHVMTPWMVLHTIGHAVAGEASRHDTYAKIRKASAKIMSHVSDSDCSGPIVVGGECQKALAKVLAFASVSATKSNTAVNNQEFVHEIIAEYLWSGGSIRVKAPYDNDTEVMSQIGIMEEEVRGMLDRCVGRVVYNYYDVSLFGPSFG